MYFASGPFIGRTRSVSGWWNAITAAIPVALIIFLCMGCMQGDSQEVVATAAEPVVALFPREQGWTEVLPGMYENRDVVVISAIETIAQSQLKSIDALEKKRVEWHADYRKRHDGRESALVSISYVSGKEGWSGKCMVIHFEWRPPTI